MEKYKSKKCVRLPTLNEVSFEDEENCYELRELEEKALKKKEDKKIAKLEKQKQRNSEIGKEYIKSLKPSRSRNIFSFLEDEDELL